jgi:hypothetical protein
VPTDGATTVVGTDAASARPTAGTFSEMGTRLCRTISPCRGSNWQSVYTRRYGLLHKVGGGESITGQHGVVCLFTHDMKHMSGGRNQKFADRQWPEDLGL